MKTAITIIHIIVTVALIVIVLLQKGKDAGLSGSIGGSGGGDTFFGKNKNRTLNGFLERLTSITAIVFIITSLVLSIFYS